LIEVGTPSTGPSGAALCQRASDTRAALSAKSSSTSLKALSVGLCLRMAASAACVASTGDSVRAQ